MKPSPRRSGVQGGARGGPRRPARAERGSGDALPALTELTAYGRELLALWGRPGLAYTLRYNRRMRTRAGAAFPLRHHIDLNPRLLAGEPAACREVFAHELAHLVVHADHGLGVRPHGPEWRALMRAAGFEPRARHGFDVRRSRRRRWLYLFLCARCPESWFGRRAQPARCCPRCGPGSVRVLRALRTPAGRRALEDLARAHAAGPLRAGPQSLRRRR